MVIWFLRGLVIAIIFGIPAGAIGALTIQRTLKSGFTTGFLTGMGSTAADVLYACVGAFGLTMVSDFLTAHQKPVGIVCGLLIIGIGLYILLRKDERQVHDMPVTATTNWRAFLSSFAVAIINPATVITFITAFAGLGFTRVPDMISGMSLVLGIGVGTTLWWLALAGLTSWIKTRMSVRWLTRAAKGMSLLMIAFGLWSVIRVM